MPGSRTPSRASFRGSASTTDSQNVALLGASVAFGRPVPTARGPSNTGVGASNGALTAATAAGLGIKTPSPKHGLRRSPVSTPSPAASDSRKQHTQSSEAREPPTLDQETTPILQPSKQEQGNLSISPSQRAAQYATARSPTRDERPSRPRAQTVHNKPAIAPKPRRLSGNYQIGDKSRSTDSSPIPPTTSLVDLFERKSVVAQNADKRPEFIVIRPSPDLALSSPKPVRNSDAAGGITSMFQMELVEDSTVPKPSKDVAVNDFAPQARYDGQSSEEDYASASENLRARTSPIAIRKRNSPAPSLSSLASPRPSTSTGGSLQPPPSPLRHSSTDPINIRAMSRGPAYPSEGISLSAQHSGKSIAAQYHLNHPRRMTPLNTDDALANAIVASSLASSRASSPRKMDPPSLSSRPPKPHTLSFSRTPSPAKHSLLPTLRKIDSSDSEADEKEQQHPYSKHKKKRLVRKHPNKHHEGDRKRWRDAVTDPERKRYEGVWAANQGLHYPAFAPPAAAARVANVVARDLWRRSRLPDAVLETVWDLVDADAVGSLAKTEFVVGLWLIDQRLKGRKLPVKVGDTVWASVRALQGIKIRK